MHTRPWIMVVISDSAACQVPQHLKGRVFVVGRDEYRAFFGINLFSQRNAAASLARDLLLAFLCRSLCLSSYTKSLLAGLPSSRAAPVKCSAG